jgi:hypothetical protein
MAPAILRIMEYLFAMHPDMVGCMEKTSVCDIVTLNLERIKLIKIRVIRDGFYQAQCQSLQ